MDEDSAEPRDMWGGELSREDHARLWQIALTDWLKDRQRGGKLDGKGGK